MRTHLVMVVVALVTLAIPAAAHHSFAAFDQSKQVTIKGEVTEFQWTNPHAWLQVKVKAASGEDEEWSFEMISPSVLRRMGWTKASVKPGDTVTVVANPAKDGKHAGLMLSVTDAAGRAIGGPAQ
jgi:hypothetical protein